MRFLAASLTGCFLCVAGAASAQVATPAWRSGFETGFPGEWLDYDGGAYTASGTPNSGQNNAWTIVSAANDPLVPHGGHAYKGWAFASQADSHRAYPGIHVDIPSPLASSFLVYLDVDYSQLSATEWVHFATWGNNPDWNVHTMSVRDRKLEMAHLDWSYIGPQPQPDFPLKQWVRFTAYIHYDGAEGYIRVWQDGTPVLEGTYDAVAGTNLMRAHWGWYSSGSIDQGVQYNDEIQIWTLSEPLTDLVTEPPSPYTPDPAPPGGGGSAGQSSGGAAGASSGGSAGASSGGSAGSGGSGGGAGSSGSGGGAGATGSGGSGAGSATPGSAEDDSGCGCRTRSSNDSNAPSALVVLGLVAVLLRRRRR